MTDRDAFIRGHTVPGHHPMVPEITLHLASEITPIWQATEDLLAEVGTEPPFWAFAWPGSVAIARHVLDNPGLVSGRAVLDFAAGCGLAAIACRQAGADPVEAAEIDPMATAAIALNARHNGVAVATVCGDLVGSACRWDLIVCGDICYEAPMTAHILPWLRLMARHAEVWIADPGRHYAPENGMSLIRQLLVPTIVELEDHTSRSVTLWRLLPE